MAQQFIVEGNDGYVLSALCEKGGLGLPVGYTKRSYPDFVVSAGGIDRISYAVLDALQKEGVTNIGVVVDANDVGVGSRIDRISAAIKEAYPEVVIDIALTPQGWITKIKPKLTFGLWVMPDNDASGYLEHFLTQLIPTDSADLALAQKFLSEVKAGAKPSFSAIRDQKALMALFLAIQDEPGMNASTAIKKGVLDYCSPLAQHFLTWFSRTFELR